MCLTMIGLMYKVKEYHTALFSCLNQWTHGTQVINECDCPFICLFRCVSPHSIIQSVCIVHECTPTCMVKHVTTTSQVGKTISKVTKIHDFGNNLYSFNIYCMHSSD